MVSSKTWYESLTRKSLGSEWCQEGSTFGNTPRETECPIMYHTECLGTSRPGSGDLCLESGENLEIGPVSKDKNQRMVQETRLLRVTGASRVNVRGDLPTGVEGLTDVRGDGRSETTLSTLIG